MGDSPKIQLEFGVPSHGWLPMKLRFKEFCLEIVISDIPSDSMVQLCDALIQINKGIRTPSRVIWHLEPYTYYFQLEIGADEYKAILSESDSFESPASQTIEIAGDYAAIILPIFRALKKFWSQAYQNPHWEPLSTERIKTLTTLVKQQK